MNFVITHGTHGSADGNWFPWLAKELRSLGHKVVVPNYPTPKNQNLDNWYKTFELELQSNSIKKDLVLIGHSIGVAFILRQLLKNRFKVKACFLVAGFISQLGLPEYDRLNQTFLADPIDWYSLSLKVEKIFVYHADNDPYVPIEYGSELAKRLGTELILIKGGGHLNSESGFNNFPRLLEDIKSILK